MRRGNRYDALFAALDEIKARKEANKEKLRLNLLEVGTYNGRRAACLASYWNKTPDADVVYWGFDLFEKFTAANAAKELTKRTPAPPMAAVKHRLLKIPNLDVHLTPGNTRLTLAKGVRNLKPDLIWLDGGHHVKTVDSDWRALEPLLTADVIMLLDDYYPDDDSVGCRRLIERLSLRSDLSVEVLPQKDSKTGQTIQVARVQRRAI